MAVGWYHYMAVITILPEKPCLDPTEYHRSAQYGVYKHFTHVLDF